MKGLGALRQPRPSQEEGCREGVSLPTGYRGKSHVLALCHHPMPRTVHIWLFFAKGGLWMNKLKIPPPPPWIGQLSQQAVLREKKNGSRPRGKNKWRSLLPAAGSSCKQTHHNKPFLICFSPTVNRFCGFCRIEYILWAEASVSDLVTVNYGSLIPEDRKQLVGHKCKQLLSPPGEIAISPQCIRLWRAVISSVHVNGSLQNSYEPA